MIIKSFRKFANHKNFSTFNKRLNQLPRPLYQYIIGANCGIFLMWHLPVVSKKFLMENFTLSKHNIYYLHHYHTLITSSFCHQGALHLGFNMVTLYFFARVIEATFGRLALLQLYLSGGLACSLLSLQQSNKFYRDSTYMGASGGLSSILTFFILNFPQEIIYVYFIPVPAWALGVGIFGYTYLNYDNTSQVSHAGHLGGMLAGALYFVAKKRI